MGFRYEPEEQAVGVVIGEDCITRIQLFACQQLIKVHYNNRGLDLVSSSQQQQRTGFGGAKGQHTEMGCKLAIHLNLIMSRF